MAGRGCGTNAWPPACESPTSRQLSEGSGNTQLGSGLGHHLMATIEVTPEPQFSHL